MQGALFAWCACHLEQRALGDAILACSAFAFAVTAIDKGAEILRSKPIALELGFVVPVSVAPRWAAKQTCDDNRLALTPSVTVRCTAFLGLAGA